MSDRRGRTPIGYEGDALASEPCEHDWRRGPAEPLQRFSATICVRCAHLGSITYDWSMPEPTATERDHCMDIVAARPAPPPIPRRVRIRAWRRDRVLGARCRLASVIAGFDV